MQEVALRESKNILLSEIDKYPVLSREEEYELALKHYDKNDLEAAKKLVVSNLKFVVKIAYEYASYGFPVSDLIQEGTIGLMRAIKKFNPHKGYRLISYAVWWIKARIHSFIMNSWSLVKIGTTQAQRKLFQKISREKKKFNIEAEELRNDDLKKVADSFGVNENEVITMEMRLASRDFSLDSNINDDESLTYLEALPDRSINQEEIVENQQTLRITQQGLQSGLDKLSQKQRYIIEKRYMSNPPAKLREIGDELDISKERVRQIESEALKKLRFSITRQLKSQNIETVVQN